MNLTSYRQTQLVIWANQLFFFGFLALNFSIWLVPVAIIMLYIFGAMSEISLHRYYTHKSYITGPVRERILRVFAFLTGQGAIMSWVTVHRTHHAYEDTKKDPHSPHHMTWWQIYLALLPTTYKNNLVIDLMRSSSVKYFLFENTYYFYMWVVLWVTTFILSPYLFFIIVAGSAMWYIGTCIVNVVSHSKGSKQFDDAVAYNNTLVNLLTGVGNHNNHHKYPGSFTYGVKGEFDAYGLLIDKVFSVN